MLAVRVISGGIYCSKFARRAARSRLNYAPRTLVSAKLGNLSLVIFPIDWERDAAAFVYGTLRKIFICNESNLFLTKGYSSWFRTQNSVHLNQKENPFYSRSACVKKKPFDSKRVYSSMFLLKKRKLTTANYCSINNHDFFTTYIIPALDNMLNLWKKPKKKCCTKLVQKVQSPGIELLTFWESQKKEHTLLPFPLAPKGKSFWTKNLVNKYLNLATFKKKILL